MRSWPTKEQVENEKDYKLNPKEQLNKCINFLTK